MSSRAVPSSFSRAHALNRLMNSCRECVKRLAACTIDPVIVYAQKRAAPLQDVPMSVSTLTDIDLPMQVSTTLNAW